MSRTTKFLKMFLPEENDYYNIETDQNENFEKIDSKLEEYKKLIEKTNEKHEVTNNTIQNISYSDDIGSIKIYSSTRKFPDGYLPADGRDLKKQEFKELFDIIEYDYGGSGEYFKIPNLKNGVFIRTTGGLAGEIGKVVEDGMPKITGHIAFTGYEAGNLFEGEGGSLFYTATDNYSSTRIEYEGYSGKIYRVSFDSSRSYNKTAPEVRPKNIALPHLIKVKDVPNMSKLKASEEKYGLVKVTQKVEYNRVDTVVSEKAFVEKITEAEKNKKSEVVNSKSGNNYVIMNNLIIGEGQNIQVVAETSNNGVFNVRFKPPIKIKKLFNCLTSIFSIGDRRIEFKKLNYKLETDNIVIDGQIDYDVTERKKQEFWLFLVYTGTV